MDKLDDYYKLIESKRHVSDNFGIKPVWLPENLFDYQKHLAEKGILKGRQAQFIDTGLGKTRINLVICHNYVLHTNKRVLIICPLAVAFQFIKEAHELGIDDIEYSKDGTFTKKIVLCNYERLSKFNWQDFEVVSLDESSILKNDKGKIRLAATAFLRKIKYRYLFTATASPNDYTELGTSSEALGYMGYVDMLKIFFTNNENTIKAMDLFDKWVLKPHAIDSFFSWISTWAVSVRKPSDLGYSDERHILPELVKRYHKVKNEQNMIIDNQIMMFNSQARRLTEIRQENKQTLEKRCEMAVELAAKHDYTVYWANLNAEADLLEKIDKDAVQIEGGMSVEKKEEILINFSEGKIKKLITKPKITSFGLNWQHCNHTCIFSTFSFEQDYQMIRRFYRFGQKRKVFVDRILSDGQQKVIDALEKKEAQMEMLFEKLNKKLNQYTEKKKEFDKEINLPKFLRG